ncbi:hypothetical protein [Clostridium aminobutyricum]|uniref:Uncharacterized protein n=1 Tax=Clostridium aminobutyricum TaxID=33953 RepID=A0A939D755_CLOAM|nr:hypothetical protein [Clostridium aminobutyricum]MBN7771978.1 hypothetical protein [Clostridium aminobutyricum]
MNLISYITFLMFLFPLFLKCCYMEEEKKERFFSIIGKVQYLAIFVLLAIAALNIDNGINTIKTSYFYITVGSFATVSTIIFCLKIDIWINNFLNKCIGSNFVKFIFIIANVCNIIIFIIYAFLTENKHPLLFKHLFFILTITLSLSFVSGKYFQEKNSIH